MGAVPIDIPPLEARQDELARIIRECADDILESLCVLKDCLNKEDLEWVSQLPNLTIPKIEKALQRVVAIKTSRNISAAASRLGMAPVSLTRWLARRKVSKDDTLYVPQPGRFLGSATPAYEHDGSYAATVNLQRARNMIRYYNAYVRGGRLVLDEPTNLTGLSEDTPVELVWVEDIRNRGGLFAAAEQAAFERELDASIAEADAGQTSEFAEVLTELRAKDQEIFQFRVTIEQRSPWQASAVAREQSESEWARDGLDAWVRFCDHAAQLGMDPRALVDVTLSDHARVRDAIDQQARAELRARRSDG